MVLVNMRVEPLVREALAAAVGKDPGRSAAAVQAMVDAGDQAVQDSVNLAAAVDAYALLDLHNGQRPEEDQLHALAASFSEMESWAEFDDLTAYRFLKALADQRSLKGTLSADVVTRIVFVMGAWLLASFGPEDRDWYTYLDEILDALESLSR